MERLPLPVQTAYAELLEQLIAIDAQRAIGHTGGAFVRKIVKGKEYIYYQQALPGGTIQRYVGRATPVLERVVARFQDGRSTTAMERSRTERLVAQLRAGGALSVDGASARILSALADAAVFRLGGVLVGTNAFIALGNVLGVRWDMPGLRTDDIDLAAGRRLEIAVPDLSADVPTILDSLEMGFLPVPGLSPKTPSTSFKVRGKSLRIDLLTPQVRGDTNPVHIHRLGAAAQPLPGLDYLLADTLAAAIVGGSGILVQVPSPARFALHKLVTAGSRSISDHTKTTKDLFQASQLIALLAQDRPGELRFAWSMLPGKRRSKPLRSAIEMLRTSHPTAAVQLGREIA